MPSPRDPSASRASGRSLTRALTGVLTSTGRALDADEVHVGLGLGLLFTSVPHEPDWALWPAYARDMFLESGARRFGLTVRALHPPDAAQGLMDAEEFAQHFDASYRPLIARALENGQPVLAWRGWGDAQSLDWGMIQSVCEEGVGLRGVAYRGDETGAATTLMSPPQQVYVVESMEAVSPEPREVADALVAHAASALDDSMDDRFGVVTGGPALGEWSGLLGEIPSDVPQFVGAHAALATSYLSSLTALARVVERIERHDLGNLAERVSAIGECAAALIDRLTPLCDARVVEAAITSPQDMNDLREHIVAMKKRVEQLASRLASGPV